MGVVQLLSAMARFVLAFALVGVAFAAEAQNVHTKKQSMQKHLSQLLEGVESSDKYSLSQKAKIESLVSKTRMDLEAIHEPEEPKHVTVAEKKAHIKKTLSKLLADVESSDKYSDEKKAKVEELVHKMRADLEKVQEHKVEVQMEKHEAAPRQTVAEKKEHIKKTLSKLLADVERSDEYSDEKQAKVEELVHKMREDLEKVGKHEKAEKLQLLLRRRQRLARPSPSCSLTLRPATTPTRRRQRLRRSSTGCARTSRMWAQLSMRQRSQSTRRWRRTRTVRLRWLPRSSTSRRPFPSCSPMSRTATSTLTRRRKRLRSSCTRCARTSRRSAPTRRRSL